MEQKRHYEGLTDTEVLASREQHGANVLTPCEKDPLWKQFLEKFEDPLIIILLIAGFLSIAISCWEYWGLHSEDGVAVFFEPVGIFIAILLATSIAFYFELKADKEFSILNQANDEEEVEVIRNGNATTVAKKDIVVGDVVIINTGAEIPADGRLLEAISLYVDESTLNGESVPAYKSVKEEEFDKDASYATNQVLRGTKVMEGHGIFVVEAVGDSTENGKVFEAAQIDDSVKTPISEQLDGLSELITKLSYVFAGCIIVGRLIVFFHWQPIVWTLSIPTLIFFWLVIKKFEGWKWFVNTFITIGYFLILMACVVVFHIMLLPEESMTGLLAHTLNTMMIAVTLIVVAVPEGLPMAVTLSLAYSMRRMMKTNNLVRKMHACETMGATTVICTDKTGTLTQNQMRVYQTQFYALDKQQLDESQAARLLMEGISVNSTASLDYSEKDKPKVLGSPTEGALLLWLNDHQISYREIRSNVQIVEELPFTTERKYMAVLVKSTLMEGKQILYVKGAPEIVYGLCKQTDSDVTKEDIERQLEEYQEQAMRTLGFAYQIVDGKEDVFKEGRVVADGLIFQGIVAISDPVRDDVPAAVAECMKAGIDVKIVTGDT